jgi:hypothetical protein
MDTLLAQSKTLSSPFVVIPLLGTAVDVAIHLKGVGDTSLAPVSGDIKVIDRGTYEAQFDSLSDSNHRVVHELGADGSGPSTFAHCGSYFTETSKLELLPMLARHPLWGS